MNKEKLTENKAEATPTGGVLLGKRDGQTMIHDKGSLSGYLVGRTHSEGGIKAVNKSTGQPLEMQGGEVVITAPAVSDNTRREFEGKMMTNREILSEINKRGGGVSFADGGDVPKSIKHYGTTYKYGGKTMTDHDIMTMMNSGGHLAKGMSLKKIAKMHGVSSLELNRQVKMGLDAESEHTSKVTEQMKIVKDHLYENPNYYSLLKKAGLKKGGEVKESLVKDAKSGNSPSRDLNNYNDLMDVQADGAVGGDSGIYADGGALGTSGLPLVNYVEITNTGSSLYKLVGTKYYNFISFKDLVSQVYKALGNEPVSYVQLQAYDSEGNKLVSSSSYISSRKNTVKNFNPSTGTPSNLEKSLSNSRPITFKKYDWSEWLSGKKSMPITQPTATSTAGLVEIPDNDPNFDKIVKSLPSAILALLMIRALEQGINVDDDTLKQRINLIKNKIDGKIFAFSNTQEGGIFWSEISKGRFTEFKRLYGKYGEKVKDIKINIPSTASASSKFSTAEIKLFEGIDDIILENSLRNVKLPIIEWGNGLGTKDFDLVNEDTGEVFMLRSHNGILGLQKEDIDLTKSLALLKDYLDWKGSQSTSATPTSTAGLVEIPDRIINFDGKVLSLPTPILDLLIGRIREQDLSSISNIMDSDITNIKDINAKLFDFSDSVEKHSFWYGISGGNFEEFKKLYGKYGEKVKDIILNLARPIVQYGSTSTAQFTSSKFTKGENDVFQQVYDYVTKNNLRVVGRGLNVTTQTEFVPFVDMESNIRYFPLKFQTVLAYEQGNILSEKFIKRYLEWLEEKQSGSSTATAQTATSKYPTINYPNQLEQTKIWIGDNPELSRKVQERAMELGFDWWSGDKKPQNLDMQCLFFSDNEKITGGDTREGFDSFKEPKEIFESDLFGSVTTTKQTQPTAPLTEEQKIASEFVADDSQLRKNDILGSSNLSKERNDLDALTKLLPSFQESKFSVEKASILKEMGRIQKNLDYKGFIASNEEVSSGSDLFTPQGLLQYYYTQATQNPTAELQPPCELPTPNGAKSKLPLSSYLNVRSSQFKKWFGDWEKAYETDNYVNCSKMIDEETKEPKIYYHGVRKYIPSFGQMSNMGVGVVRPYGSFEPPNFPASYFSDNESYANFYGGIAENMPKPSEGYKPFIYKVFLCIKNPISLLPLDFEVSYKDLIDYIFVAYGVRLNFNSVLLKQIGEDMNKKHPMWVYIRRDIGLIETLKDYGYDALIQQGDIPVFDKDGNAVEDRSKYIQDTEYLSFYPNQVKSATVKKSFYFNFFNDIRFKKGGYVCI